MNNKLERTVNNLDEKLEQRNRQMYNARNPTVDFG